MDAMEGAHLDEQRSVLIVDPSEETREVLQTALQRRGMRTLSASRVKSGIELARRHRPDLIVLDLELDDSAQEGSSTSLAEQFRQERTPVILLGRVCRDHRALLSGEFVAKPYHYAPLIRRIEELLNGCAIGDPGPCHRCS